MSNRAIAIDTTITTEHASHGLWSPRLWCIAVLTLIAATWRLWMPSSDFPSVPAGFGWFDSSYLHVGSVGSIVLGLGYIVASNGGKRTPFLMVAVGLMLAFACNQHRLQPWAYQAFLHSIAMATFAPRHARNWIGWISISIYFYSACGKFDFQFLHTVGQEFISPILGAGEGPPSRLRLSVATFLPITELLIAVGLCFQRTRRVAGIAAIGMHVSLIVALGPWLLGHSLGVLLWNAWLSILAWGLFVAPGEQASQSQSQASPRFTAPMGATLLILSMLLPLAERTGYWDHWLSWSLYSPHTSRVEIELHRSALGSLPNASKPFVAEDDDGDGWHSLAIDEWSLGTLGVPVYPQARFQLGVAVALVQHLPTTDTIRAKVRSASDRWSGRRSEKWLAGGREIERATTDYWLLVSQEIP